MLILISDAFDPSLPERLAAFGEVTTDKSRVAEARVVLIRSKTKCTREYIDQAPKLKLIIRGGVGLDNVDRAYAAEKGVIVHNTPLASSIAVAELAFALMLAVPNRLIDAHNTMADGRWEKKALKRTELYGKTLCLIGVGNIAIEVAKRAKAFGMTVVAYRQSGRPSEHAEVKPTLLEAVAGADYVSMHTPLTPETKGMFNAEVIAAMKDGAVLVNTGRGKCVVAEDVVAALESGKLAAYATDVWPSDPPPDDYPILKAPNVLMAPHLGASSKENLLRIGDTVVELVERYTKEGVL
jgi:D-3-phosphoglycerate dehydrogenase / 2-oxoglutarate reductase